MRKALTLSIIIPAYNEEAYIERCLEGIKRQTVPIHEVIVVDNNSSDQTALVTSKYPFVTLLHESRQGLYFARQAGMEAATGDILCRIDADTIVADDWAENIQEAFSDGETNALTGPVGYHDFIFPRTSQWGEDKCLKLALKIKYHFLFGCNMAMRASVWREIADELCADSHLMEDIDITTHYLGHGYETRYSEGMRVLVSARRAEDSPRAFYRYIKGHSRTMKHHGLPVSGAYFAESCFFAAYILFKPLHLLFDPMQKKFTIRRLFSSSLARPDPMNTEAKGNVSYSSTE